MEGEESGHATSEAILCWDVKDEDGQHAETSVTSEASASCSQNLLTFAQSVHLLHDSVIHVSLLEVCDAMNA